VEQYSPDRRTALVFGGTGADGAYQAGALRALQEAGVKIDVVAGHGIGAVTAAMAAIDGGSRLWEPDGLWRGPHAASLYPWKRGLVIPAWIAAVLLVVALTCGTLVIIGQPVPPWLSILAALLALCCLGSLATAVILDRIRTKITRRAVGPWWWRVIGAPVDGRTARELVTDMIWGLIRGAAPLARPDRQTLGRRYAEVLAESLGQPGFRELILVAHDLETHSDLVAALLRESYRRDFMARRPGRERRAEALDLAGVGRDHGVDVVCGALSPSIGTDPYLITFAPDTYWRGETHRLVDRVGGISRVFEELYAAGVSQVIVVTAIAVASGPHRLTSPGLDFRKRMGEMAASAEAAATRDAIEQARVRFDGIFAICPSHNPVGSLDFTGAYDQASDRHHTLAESMERGYEDAYRQFIEPVVGASGDHLQIGDAHGQGVLDDADSPR
jgi:hypothetical protein